MNLIFTKGAIVSYLFLQFGGSGRDNFRTMLMRFTALIFIISLGLQFVTASEVGGQNLDQIEVTIELNNDNLKSVFRKIENQTDLLFSFPTNSIDDYGPFFLRKEKRTVKDVLDMVLSDTPFSYQQASRNVIIANKQPHESSTPTNDSIDDSRVITGTVTDEKGTRLPGVNLVVKGTTIGTTTDDDGYFLIDVPDDAEVLIVTFVGMEPLEIEIGDRTVIDITMNLTVTSLNELVVYSTGYNQIPKERSTGSFAQIDKELLERNVGSDLNSRLSGITPSLLIDQRSGEETYYSIRGRSTIYADDQPLIVVDNFPYSGDINSINPNDILSITVLRDAAAASIWGARAGNGVIVITTKTGAASSGIQVNLNTNVTIGDIPDLYYQNKISTSDFIDVEHLLFDNGYYDGTISDARQPAISPVVEILLSERNGDLSESEANGLLDGFRSNDVRRDLEEYFYQKSVQQQYLVDISGGDQFHSHYTSIGYDHNLSNLVTNSNDRISLSTRHKFRPFDNFEIDSRLAYTQSKSDANSQLSNIRMGARNIYPYAQLADEQGNSLNIIKDYRQDFVNGAEDLGFLNWAYNPIDELDYGGTVNKTRNVLATTSLTYFVTEDIDVSFRYQYESQVGQNRDLSPIESYQTRDLINSFSVFDGSTVTGQNIPEGGILTFSNSDLRANTGRFQINYTKSWSVHDISALSGLELRERRAEGYSNRFYGYSPRFGGSSSVDYTTFYQSYPTGSFSTIPDFQGVSGTIDRFRSYFTNAAYTYDSRYTISISGRIDQSNLFGVKTNQKSVPLWSVGTKWNITNESFFNVPKVDQLSLRATFGKNGNIDQSAVALTTASFLNAQYTGAPAARVSSPPNPELRWEQVEMLNLGLDFGLLNGRLNGSVEYYSKNAVDLIGFAELDPTIGFDSYRGNVATIKGSGWDIILNSINYQQSIKWTTSLLVSIANDKVTKYQVEPTSTANYFIDGSLNRSEIFYTPTEGKPLFSIYSYKWAGLDPDTGDPRGFLNGQPSSDYTSLFTSATVDSLIYHGPALPTLFGAIRNNITYKGWTFSANVSYKFGHFFRRSSINYSSLFENYDGHSDYSKRWTQPGDETSTNVPSLIYPANTSRDSFYSRSEILVEKGDNIRLQDIQLSYEFPKLNIGNVNINRLQLYGYINNVGILWKATKTNLDPDYPTMTSPRTYSLGLRMGL